MEGRALARDALFRLKPGDPVIVANWRELFELTQAAAADRDARVINFIDRNFLTSDQDVYIPQHALKLDPTLICVFLYGAYGPDAETHLKSLLSTKSVSNRVLEILGWLGSPGSLAEVGRTLSTAPTYPTLLRVTSYMMQVAGPEGRDFMLKLDSKALDQQSRAYLAKIRPEIQSMSFDAYRRALARFPGDKNLPDSEVKARLSAMETHYGVDQRTSPVAFLESGLDSGFLINSLMRIRSLMLNRLSDEALDDVQIANSLINALRFRGH